MGLEPKLMIEELGATVLSGLTGGDIKMPVANSYSFEWLAEGANITGQKGTFTGPTLSPKRAGAAVSLTNRLLMQSSISADNLVMDLLRKGWANAINSAAINGAGGNAPTGILNTAGINTAAASSNEAATFAKIVELQGLIEEDDSTELRLAYLIHPKLKAVLKTKSKDTGSGRFLIEGNELDGYRFVSTSLMPVGDDTGTDVYPMIFGDFSQLYVANWGSFSFLLNPYSEDLADSVRITVNTHADVAIANPEAFAVNSFFNLS
jgi:HK97 family phage major capsid protein